MDKLSKEQRSKNMRAVKSKDSKMEVRLRKALWAKGYRYRKNYKRIFGTPDIVFIRQKVAVFCDSEFWHGYDWERKKHEIKSNREFWYKKIESNIKRDETVNKTLADEGWMVLRFWERDVKKNLDACVAIIEHTLKTHITDEIKKEYAKFASEDYKWVAEGLEEYKILLEEDKAE